MTQASQASQATDPHGPQPRTLIVGAGIGGLTCAVALRRQGFHVEVVERAPTFAPVGAGITIQVNASAVLRALGINFSEHDACSIGQVAMLDPQGRPLVQGDPGTGLPEFPSLNIRRPDLHRVLAEACGDTPIHLGRPVRSVTPSGDRVEVSFEDGEPSSWDLVVGADGIHSAVRRSILDPEACTPRYSGQTCWRFVVEAPDLVPEITVERWSPGRRVGVVPLSRGGIYVYMVQSAPEGTIAPGSDALAEIRTRFADADGRLDALLDRAEDQAVRAHHGDLHDLPQQHFGRGRVVLIGDAAHAMTPNMGQGAAMAIEDAGALGLLAAQAPLEDLAERLASVRRDRVSQIHARSWQIGQMAHWEGTAKRWLRDLMLRSTPAWLVRRNIQGLYAPGIELADRLAHSPPETFQFARSG